MTALQALRSLSCLLTTAMGALATPAELPADVATMLAALPNAPVSAPDVDWLVHDVPRRAAAYRGNHAADLVLDNGLVRRTWRLAPNAACVALDRWTDGTALLRAVKPEARLVLDGVRVDVGGLRGQPDHAYLTRQWLDAMEADPDAMSLVGAEIGPTRAPFAWKRARWSAPAPWPPPGVALRLDFRTPRLPDITVSVHHELYDGMPLFTSWLELHNNGSQALHVDELVTPILAFVEAESIVEPFEQHRLPAVSVQSDYSFGGMDPASSSRIVHWVEDPEYMTQVNYQRAAPLLLECRPPVGPGVSVLPGQTLTSFRAHLLIHDSTDRERQGLGVRRLWRALAPWVTESPLMMHVRHADDESVARALEQCASVGFEMLILTFGSGFDIEDDSEANLARWKGWADAAHARGLELGGYSLLSSRRIDDATDVIDAATGHPGGARFGNAPCLGSAWGQAYFDKLTRFFEATGFDLLEHDGSYPGDFCASTNHPGHQGHDDSQWTQWRTITDFYKWCRGRGVSLNVPDLYPLAGSTKIAMGYRETNWSLPRAQQILHARQNIFDGTWEKPPTMGWMFVPLTQYHGGGAAATIEPLSEHLADYEAHLANCLGLGVQACYRGPRLYDTEQTRAAVARWVTFFKRHRAILESDLLHLRRADGRDLDYMLHVNSKLTECAMLLVYNPLDEPRRKTLGIPLYYAGLETTTTVTDRDGETRTLNLDREYAVQLDVELPARGVGWWVFRAP